MAVVRVLAVVACLVAVPIAGAAGTITYTDSAERIRVDAAAKTPVAATVTADPAPAEGGGLRARLRWDHDGRTGSSTAPVPDTATRGDLVTVWIGPDHSPTTPPASSRSAALTGIGTGIAVLIGTVATSGLVCGVLSRVLRWQHTRLLDAEWHQYAHGHR